MNYSTIFNHTLIWLWFIFYVSSIVIVLPKPSLFRLLVSSSEPIETETQDIQMTPRILLRAFLLLPLIFLVSNVI